MIRVATIYLSGFEAVWNGQCSLVSSPLSLLTCASQLRLLISLSFDPQHFDCSTKSHTNEPPRQKVCTLYCSLTDPFFFRTSS